MGFRVGKKVGDYYVSTGKSGTRISKNIGGYNVSYWTSNKKKLTKNSDSVDVRAAEETPEERALMSKFWLWQVVTLGAYLLVVWKTGQILAPLPITLFINIIGNTYIAWNEESKWLLIFSPIIFMFAPIGWIFWIPIMILAFLIS